jgi:hypothetical protein
MAQQGRRHCCSRRARAWSLEAEGEVTVTGSSSTCSRRDDWQRTSIEDSSSLRGTEAPQGMGVPQGMAVAARDRGAMGDGDGGTAEWGGRTAARHGEATTARGGVGIFYERWARQSFLRRGRSGLGSRVRRDRRPRPSVSAKPAVHRKPILVAILERQQC